MTEAELKERFKKFALDVYNLTKQFPRTTVYFKIEDQLVRCSSSAASNYRAACRGKSLVDFIAKLALVEEETDESVFWLEYTNGVEEKWEPFTKPLIKEGNELTAIIVASLKLLKEGALNLKHDISAITQGIFEPLKTKNPKFQIRIRESKNLKSKI